MTWHEVSLKQICAVDWGNTKLTKSSYLANGKFLAVSAAGADGLIDHFEHEADVPVLSAIGAHCGRMFYPGERFTAIKNTITLTPKENMADGKFLYYLFTYVELPQRGAGQPFISKGDIEAFRVSIPESLEEQRKIVEKLDSAFAEIEVAKLQTSYSIQNLSKLLDSKFEEVFIIMENEYGLVQSGTLIDVRDGTHDSPSYYDSGYPLITSKNLQDGLIDFAKVSLISKDDYDQINKRSKVETGDLLFAMIVKNFEYIII